jgi:hypothetical protein
MEINRKITSAITWRIVAELFRRHEGDRKLTVLETHPGGGMYDCLSLISGENSDVIHLCDFNQQSRHLHPFVTGSQGHTALCRCDWPDGNDYVLQWLRVDDPKTVVDQIESVLGLSEFGSAALPPTTPSVLVIRLIADLCKTFMLERFGLDIRNGYFDTAGIFPSRIRPELKSVTAIASEIPLDRTRAENFARGFWLVYRETAEREGSMKMVFDLRGKAYFKKGSKELTMDLTKQYRIHRNMTRLVTELATFL